MNKQKPKVIITEHLGEEQTNWLSARVNLVQQSFEEVTAFQHQLTDADGLVVRTYTQINDDLLDKAPRLKVVGRAGVGLDNFDLDACQKRNVQVVYTPNANTQAVVEYVTGLMLDAVRPRYILDHYVPPPKFHQLRSEQVGKQLDHMTVGILGMGRIGRRIADVAHAVGMRVLYNDLLTHRQLNLPDNQPGEFVDLTTLCQRSHIFTIHTDGRPENKKMINTQLLNQLKNNCLLINAARGMLIDNEALLAWSKQVESTGGEVYLDVHDPEPPTDDYPLFGLPNVKLLPHLASRTPQAMSNMSWVVRDVFEVLQGNTPKYPAIL